MTGDLNWNTNLSSHAVELPKVINLGDYRQSRSISMDWKKHLLDELANIASEENELNQVSALRAKEFIRDLPLQIEAPSVGIEENGNVLIEWYKKPRLEEPTIFSIILGSDNYIFSSLQNGVPDSHGALNYSHQSLDMILILIQKNFGIMPHARLKA
jgi:hypothetical protein